MSETQCDKILKHLRSGRSITALDALNEYGCFRLASRINDLKNEGYLIRSTPWKTKGGATISMYTLIGGPAGKLTSTEDGESCRS